MKLPFVRTLAGLGTCLGSSLTLLLWGSSVLAQPPATSPYAKPAQEGAAATTAAPADKSSTDAAPAQPDHWSGGGCGANGCDANGCGNTNCAGGQWYGRVEYLLWWIQSQPLPALVTTSPPGTIQSQAGVLGVPGTTILFGDQRVNDDVRSGGRFTFGKWFDCDNECGIEVTFWGLEDKDTVFNASCNGNGSPIIARPFFNVLTNKPDSELVCFPKVVNGNITVLAESGSLWDAEVNLRKCLCCGSCCGCSGYRVDGLVGYRFLHYRDSIDINEDLMPTSSLFVPGTRLTVLDHFKCEDEFNGGQIGLIGTAWKGHWSLEGVAKLAMGDVERECDISGFTIVQVPNQPTVSHQGGFLALSSNIGHHTSDAFAVIPEFGLNVGYQLTQKVRLTAGYNFLLLNDFWRAGNQIDTNVNPNLIPPSTNTAGPARPAFLAHESDFWVQGIQFGLEFKF
jgi:hypothetical protein